MLKHKATCCSRLTVWLASLSLMLMATLSHGDPQNKLTLYLGGNNASGYLADLLQQALQATGHDVEIVTRGTFPTTRLERMLSEGTISVMMLGETSIRNREFLPIRVGMTNNLVNHRILFVPNGQEEAYIGIRTLTDLIERQKVAGVGSSWRDYGIWNANGLPAVAIDGDWKRVYKMVASGNRGIDYLPRGAHEIAMEWPHHPELSVEPSLVLVYDRDHILYVSPNHADLYPVLAEALLRAEQSGLLAAVAHTHFQAVFEPPINLHSRHRIQLQLDEAPVASEPVATR
ncbi:MAG: hypothetical protein LAT63_09455 [Marinobacter sp.]|nr:hypothetical protein [Marinobacter sp.]